MFYLDALAHNKLPQETDKPLFLLIAQVLLEAGKLVTTRLVMSAVHTATPSFDLALMATSFVAKKALNETSLRAAANNSALALGQNATSVSLFKWDY